LGNVRKSTVAIIWSWLAYFSLKELELCRCTKNAGAQAQA
jgi:hypothetical protein